MEDVERRCKGEINEERRREQGADKGRGEMKKGGKHTSTNE